MILRHRWRAAGSDGSLVVATRLNVLPVNGDPFWMSVKHLRLRPSVLSSPASSKIEETVNRLKKKQEEKLQEIDRLEGLQRTVKTVIELDKKEEELRKKEAAAIEASEKPGSLQEDSSKTTVSLAPRKTLWVRFVDEVKHYYSGFKLLFLDVRICSKIVWKVLQGHNLTRRENKQLVRTVSDLFRLVPFSVFVIVPFMEFLLPVALKLFPGMLPSTFTTSSEFENKQRRTLKAKLEYAKFLQKTLDEMAPASQEGRSSKSARDFVEFYKSVKERGGVSSTINEDIVKFSQVFEDEITLDNMERGQLVALCKLVELTPMGTNNFLRFQLEMKVRQLRIDDRVIQKEGLDNLTVSELQFACRERGMRALGLTEKALTSQLEQWLDLSLNRNVPTSLLLLSRTLYLPETLGPAAQIVATISSLPESTATRASAAIGEREGKIRNVNRLEIIKEEQRKIEEEAAEAADEAKEKEKQEILAAAVTAVKEEIIRKAEAGARPRVQEIIKEHIPEKIAQEIPSVMRPAVRGAVVAVAGVPEGQRGAVAEVKHETAISSEDLQDIKNAIESIRTQVGDEEREDVSELKKELQDYEEDLEEFTFVKAEAGRFDLQERKGARRLFRMVNQVLSRVDPLVKGLQQKEKRIAEQLKEGEMSDADKEKDEAQRVTVHELIEAVQKLQKTPDSSKVEHIAQVST